MQDSKHNQDSKSSRRDLIRLLTGTGLAQLVGVIAAPILVRLYSPEFFGEVALFVSVSSFFGVLACLQYENAILLPKKYDEAANLLVVSLSFSLLIALLTLSLVLFFGDKINIIKGASVITPFLLLIPLAVFIQGVLVALSCWSTRHKIFSVQAYSQVGGQLTNNVGSIGVAGAGCASGGMLIVCNIAGQVVAASILFFQIFKVDGPSIVRAVNWNEMVACAKRYKRFPLFTPWSALLNVASWQLPILMLGAYFSTTIVGFYILGFRIIQLPMNFIGKSIGQVFIQRANESKHADNLGQLVENSFIRLLTVSLLPCAVLAVAGEDFFVLVFGSKWSESGVIAQLLAPWALVWFISSPLSSLYYVLEKQREELWLQATIFFSRALSIWIGGVLGDYAVAIGLFSLTGVLTYGYLIYLLFKFVGLKILIVLKLNCRLLIESFLFIIPLIIIKYFFQLQIITISVSILIVIVFFYRRRLVIF